MLRIRLSRVGKRKQPSYRLVVADSRKPRDGAFIKIIGHYNPRTEPTTLVVKEEEAVEWLRRGAQPSETVAKLLTRLGVMERAGRAPLVWDRKTPVKPKKEKEEPAAETAAAAAPAQAKATAAKPPAEPEAAAPETPPEDEPTATETETAAEETETVSEESAPAEEAAETASEESETAAEEDPAEPAPEAAEPEGEPKEDAKATE